MRILMLGGTRFMGRAVTETALARGHAVSVFHRGNSALQSPGAEEIIGDRDGGLGALAGRTWDAVVDMCGYYPRVVGQALDVLRPAAGHYTFVSSVSVYADTSTPGITEDAPVGVIEDETVEVIDEKTYGPLKALCEARVRDAFGDSAFIPRPGLMVGPNDSTDRFTYWPVRLARGGDVLVPDDLDLYAQFIDARDIAEWIVPCVERGLGGSFNLVGPRDPLTLGEFLQRAKAALGSDANLVPVSPALLEETGVEAWTDLPLWVPGAEWAGIHRVSAARAQAEGLTYRPVETTVRDTAEWAATRPADYVMKAGLKPEREAEVLARAAAAQR